MADRYRSPNCLGGAHRACPNLSTACGCPCHVEQAVRTVERVPSPTITMPNPLFLEMEHRRAVALCRDSEPHIGSDPLGPCVRHQHEARAQLTEQWAQDNRAESEVA